MPALSVQVEVRKDDLHQWRVARDAPAGLTAGQVLVRIDHFGLTANNVTYAAVAGDLLGYWRFFPTADGWGRVPTWGFADVLDSTHPDVAAGTRLYGYLPMGTHLVLTPGAVTDRDVVDASPHRRDLPPAYNTYRVVANDPLYDPARERQQMVLLPLFFTSFVLDDFFADADFFGADTLVLSSASCKTAIGAASLLAERGGPRVVGLTSSRNQDAVRALGVYDEVLSYADSDALPGVAAAYLDFAGDLAVRRAVHERYGDRLVYSSVIGGTHWAVAGGSAGDLPGASPAFFFAPEQIRKRSDEWGREELDRRLAAAWVRFSGWSDGWLGYDELRGPEAVGRAFVRLLDGEVEANRALVCSLWEEER